MRHMHAVNTRLYIDDGSPRKCIVWYGHRAIVPSTKWMAR
jgi:hypothetical protein